MRWVVGTLAAWIALLSLPAALAAPHEAARHKTGPVSVRGIASGVHSGGFSLKTATKGTYAVVTRAQTQISEKGKRGRVTIAEGDHVRVRGFVNGKTLTAISVQVISVKQKAKAYTLRGTVQTVSSTQLLLSGGTTHQAIRLTSKTVVDGATSSVSGLRRTDRVSVRLEKDGAILVALRIHVYKRVPTGQHVQLRGTVQSVSSGAITISAGSVRYRIALTAQTSLHKGTMSATQRDLRIGETVTVYACCQGGALTATSVHILQTRAKRVSIEVHGIVVALAPGRIALRTSTGTLTVTVSPSTPTSIGSSPASSRDVRAGDEVAVRATKQGAVWIANRIHVLAGSRQTRNVDGTVVAVSRNGITVDARGKHYVVTLNVHSAVSIGARKATLGSIHKGDRVKVSGQLSGSTLTGVRVVVTPPKTRSRTVRGVIQSVSSGGIAVTDASGAHYLVRPARGIRVLLHGQVAPAGAIFPGAKIEVRGQVASGVLTASKISISVQARTVAGRVTKIGRLQVVVLGPRSAWTLDMAGKPSVVDGKRAVSASSLRPGAYLKARGYEEAADRLRATRIAVVHKQLSLAATVVSAAGALVVQTAAGERYTLVITSTTVLSAGRAQVALTVADIPVGARVHVDGMIGADGKLAVSEMTVRLASITARGRITALSASSLTIATPSSTVIARILSTTVLMQGTHALTWSDLVMGDDVTLYGYKASTVLARKLLVHRKRTSVSGTVASITPDGFMLTSADGPHRIVVSNSTVVSLPAGQTLVVGAAVRVSGYLRGDGVLLATRVVVHKAQR